MESGAFIIFLFVAGTIGSAIIFFAISKSRLSFEALRDYAHSNNWQIQKPTASLHDTIIQPPDNEWQLVMYFYSNSESVSSSQWTEWRSNKGALDSGLAALGSPLPAKTAEKMKNGKGGLFWDMVTKQLFNINTASDRAAFKDCLIVAESADDPRGAVLASPGNENSVDMFKELPELAPTRTSRNTMNHPIIFRDSKGLRIRLYHKIKTVEEADGIISLGIAMLKKLETSDASQE